MEPSASVPVIMISSEDPSSRVFVTLETTGGSLTGTIVMVTVAVLLVACDSELSVTLNVKVSDVPSPPPCS